MTQPSTIISIREHPSYLAKAIAYFQTHWGTKGNLLVYDDCLRHCIDTNSPLPQWYLLLNGEEIIGAAGLVTNDFISRMDLYPWICALYIDEAHRGKACGARLLEKAKADALRLGFPQVFLSTSHVGYYEKYGFSYLGKGYHPWGESSRIYAAPTKAPQ